MLKIMKIKKKRIYEVEEVFEYALFTILFLSWVGIFYQLYTGRV